jgi:hypothetical protein
MKEKSGVERRLEERRSRESRARERRTPILRAINRWKALTFIELRSTTGLSTLRLAWELAASRSWVTRTKLSRSQTYFVAR